MIAIAAEAYARMMRGLLPRGRAWETRPGQFLFQLLLGAADELARVSLRVIALLDEADPRTAVETLPDYERNLRLTGAGSNAQRQAAITELLTRQQRFRPADVRASLAALLGQAPADVVVIERGRAFAVAVDNDREIYRFFVYRDPTLPGAYDVGGAQLLLDKISHSHTKGHVIESVSFFCDDPYSLCDRDLLGA